MDRVKRQRPGRYESSASIAVLAMTSVCACTLSFDGPGEATGDVARRDAAGPDSAGLDARPSDLGGSDVGADVARACTSDGDCDDRLDCTLDACELAGSDLSGSRFEDVTADKVRAPQTQFQRSALLRVSLEGADLWYEIRRARALLKRQAIPARTGPERTDFTALKGSATVVDGVVASNDLTMAMQYLRVAGKATIDLPKSTIDSRLEATVLRIPAEGTDAAGMQELVNARIPVRITGPLASPKALPDIEGLIKEQVKEKVQEKIRDTIQDRLRRALGGR